MKKLFTLITMALMAVGGVKAGEEVDIDLNNWNWSYNAAPTYADGVLTITLTGNWGQGSIGWDPAHDWSMYGKMSVVIESYTNDWGKITVTSNTLKEGSSDSYVLVAEKEFGSITSTTTIDVPLDNQTLTSGVRQIAIQGKATGDIIKVSRVYLTEAVTYNSTTLWEGTCDFGTGWSSGFNISADKFASASEGDILEFIYTTSSTASYFQFKTIFSGTDPAEPLTSNSSDLNSYGCAGVSSGSTNFRITLNASDVAKLKETGLYTAGYACVVTKVNLLSATENTPDPIKQLSLTDLGSGWNAEYAADTKTITITGNDAGEGGGKGWWLAPNDVPTDYSYYDNVVIEFDPATTNGGWVTVDYAVEGANSSYAEFNPGATCVVIPLDVTNKDKVKQIYISGAKGATYTLKAAFVAVASETPEANLGTAFWTVAGVDAVLGSEWSATDTNNDMTTTDGVIYTLVKEDVTLEAGQNYAYKVVKNHSWSQSYPQDNATLTVSETAKYKVTFTFNATTHEVSYSTEKTGEAEGVTHTYRVIGTLVGGWEEANEVDMTENPAGSGIYTATITDVEAGNYEYKVRADHAWTIQYPATADNYSIEITAKSTVVITLNTAAGTVNHQITITDGISAVKAGQQLSGVRYNLAGQKVDASYKGVVIVDGKKLVQK